MIWHYDLDVWPSSENKKDTLLYVDNMLYFRYSKIGFKRESTFLHHYFPK